MNFRKNKHQPLEISLTPMIDVVFLLLIFFMVTTTFSQQTAIKIQLPQADGQAKVERQQQVLMLTIAKGGQYYINDKALADGKLSTLSKALSKFSSNKHIPLVINADARAPVQSAISVLDVASKIGFTNITFVTEKEE
ncbi:MAG: biopolymer transporter ExbD [Methyloprofundus sp.]|nr:biopolymer transporter ExbD [Methyloprofundus sp.]